MSERTGYLLSDNRDLADVFIKIDDSVSLISQNTFPLKQTFCGNVNLSGSLLFYDLSYSTQSAPYPIGYTLDVSNTITNPTSGIIYNTNLTLYPGVWLTTCGLVLTRGTGTYTNASFYRLDLSNCIYSPPSPFLRIPIDISNTLPTMQVTMTTVAVITASSATIQAETLVVMTVSATTSLTFYLSATKIA